MHTKEEIRSKNLSLQDSEYESKSNDLIISNLISLIQILDYKYLGLYYPMKNEVDIKPIFNVFLNLALPKMLNKELVFTKFIPIDTILVKNKFGFFEPEHSEIIIPDMLIIPALAFDIKGARIGRGYGHYDKYLATKSLTKIGIIPDTRLYEECEQQDFDIKMNYIVTEKRTIICT